MNHILSILATGAFCFILALCAHQRAEAAASGIYEPELPLSDMQIRITAQGKAATFQLYDTAAARELYEQLPLTLALTNFRDAQWMFYPPRKLNVTAREAYHDGKKGELSYYAPWGDVFMLYKDFHAGDEMHRLGVGLSGIDHIASMSGSAVIEKNVPDASKEVSAMQIQVIANGRTIVFELNDSQAARDLVAQLPLDINVENYGSNEKIFYPARKLNKSGAPLAKDVRPGTLCYYAPWATWSCSTAASAPPRGCMNSAGPCRVRSTSGP